MLLTIITTNVVGLLFIYLVLCFFDWKIVKIPTIDKWKPASRLALLVAMMMLTFIGVATSTCC